MKSKSSATVDLFNNNTQVDTRTEKYCARIPDLVGDWVSVLKGNNLSEIIDVLIKAADLGRNILPGSGTMFRCFKESPLSKTKVVFIAQDPYYQPGVADGLAFSCGKTRREQASLKLMFDELKRTYDSNYQRDPDLIRWANQGVLLLNTALTVEADKPDSHTELWAPFIRMVIPRICEAIPDVIFVFVGGRAKAYQNFAKGPRITKYGVIHPAAAAHRGGQWDCDDVFNNINKTLAHLGKGEISW